MADIFMGLSNEEKEKGYNLLQDINAIDNAITRVKNIINTNEENIVINKTDFEAYINSYIPENEMDDIIEKEASKSKGKITINEDDLKTLLKYSMAYKEIIANQRQEITNKVENKEYIDFQGQTR